MKPCDACQMPVLWLSSDATGKRAPIDAYPSDRGNIVLNGDGTYHVLTDAEKGDLFTEPDPRPRHLSHFVTCTDPGKFRRRCKRCRHSPCSCPKEKK